jgi:hypothetical protein
LAISYPGTALRWGDVVVHEPVTVVIDAVAHFRLRFGRDGAARDFGAVARDRTSARATTDTCHTLLTHYQSSEIGGTLFGTGNWRF